MRSESQTASLRKATQLRCIHEAALWEHRVTLMSQMSHRIFYATTPHRILLTYLGEIGVKRQPLVKKVTYFKNEDGRSVCSR